VKSRRFVDSVKVHAQAGQGGNGCVSFRREKFVPLGGPDGGDGGDGGSVILLGDRDTESLVFLYFSPHQRADDGGHGKGKQLYGRGGKDRIVKVPCGTEVWNIETGALLADITGHGQEFVLAKGGKGGRGNMHWMSATHQAPTEHTAGEPGLLIHARLELKVMADVGLIGFPNAGKSSLLSRITDAHPKIAAYPFTTLNPVVGTMVFEDYARISVADIPGLIDGAHDGVGLGHAFLKHVERAAALVLVIDMAGVDGRKPWDDYRIILRELELHDATLLQRPILVVANKMDLPESADNLAEFTRDTGHDPVCVSAASGEGTQGLRASIRALIPVSRYR
jgi:GTP-binding protein